jgi:hypothetical protein
MRIALGHILSSPLSSHWKHEKQWQHTTISSICRVWTCENSYYDTL